MITEYNHICFGLGSVAGFLPKIFKIIFAGTSVSCYLSKCQLEKADNGNGVICSQNFIISDGPFGGGNWITTSVSSQ